MLFSRYLLALLAVGLVLFAAMGVREYLRKRKLASLYRTGLNPQQIAVLKKHVPLSIKVPEQLTKVYHGHINFFLHDKSILGRGGFEITEKEKLVIAGNACLLVLTRHDAAIAQLKYSQRIFPGFKTILVYPDTYHAPSNEQAAGTVSQKMERRAGESWYRGPVVLSWKDVERGSSNISDGHNVVIHEFVHKLDEENQLMDGLPILKQQQHYSEWAEVLSDEFQAFLRRVKSNKNTVIDSYGAISPVEFFAVISESFFEKPQQMQRKLPALYEQLSQYYGVDTANW